VSWLCRNDHAFLLVVTHAVVSAVIKMGKHFYSPYDQ
jgi:hypothetical protein